MARDIFVKIFVLFVLISFTSCGLIANLPRSVLPLIHPPGDIAVVDLPYGMLKSFITIERPGRNLSKDFVISPDEQWFVSTSYYRTREWEEELYALQDKQSARAKELERLLSNVPVEPFIFLFHLPSGKYWNFQGEPADFLLGPDCFSSDSSYLFIRQAKSESHEQIKRAALHPDMDSLNFELLPGLFEKGSFRGDSLATRAGSEELSNSFDFTEVRAVCKERVRRISWMFKLVGGKPRDCEGPWKIAKDSSSVSPNGKYLAAVVDGDMGVIVALDSPELLVKPFAMYVKETLVWGRESSHLYFYAGDVGELRLQTFKPE